MITTILAAVAIIVSIASLTIGCVALAFVIGLKNSTHQVVWKPLEPAAEADPFSVNEPEEEVALENPNKRIKKEAVVEDEEPFRDISDPTITSNNW